MTARRCTWLRKRGTQKYKLHWWRRRRSTRVSRLHATACTWLRRRGTRKYRQCWWRLEQISKRFHTVALGGAERAFGGDIGAGQGRRPKPLVRKSLSRLRYTAPRGGDVRRVFGSDECAGEGRHRLRRNYLSKLHTAPPGGAVRAFSCDSGAGEGRRTS